MIRKESIIENKRKRLMRFIATELFRRRRHGRRLFLTLTSFTRRTCNGLDRNSQIAMAYRCRNKQTVRRVRKRGWRRGTGIRRLRNNMMRGLGPSRMKGVGDVRRRSVRAHDHTQGDRPLS